MALNTPCIDQVVAVYRPFAAGASGLRGQAQTVWLVKLRGGPDVDGPAVGPAPSSSGGLTHGQGYAPDVTIGPVCHLAALREATGVELLDAQAQPPSNAFQMS